MVEDEKILNVLKLSIPKKRIIDTFMMVINKLSGSVNGIDLIPDKLWEDYVDIFDEEELYRRLIPLYKEVFNSEEIEFITYVLKNPLYEKWINLQDINSKGFKETSKITEEYHSEIFSALMVKNNNNGYS